MTTPSAAFLPFLILIPLLFVGLALTVFWIWMLVDCARNEKEAMQVGWLLAIILGPICTGALLYLFCRKLPRVKSQISN